MSKAKEEFERAVKHSQVGMNIVLRKVKDYRDMLEASLSKPYYRSDEDVLRHEGIEEALRILDTIFDKELYPK